MFSTGKTREAFEGITDLIENSGKLTYEQIKEKRDQYFKIIHDEFVDQEGNPLYGYDDLAIMFGFATDEGYKIQNRINDAIEKMGLSDVDAS